MGFAFVLGTCFSCRRVVSFNPRTVPSYKGEPICRECIEVVNAKRRALGNPEWPVAEDAYEPVEEGAL